MRSIRNSSDGVCEKKKRKKGLHRCNAVFLAALKRVAGESSVVTVMKTQGAAAHLAGQGQHLHSKPALPRGVDPLGTVPDLPHLIKPNKSAS